MKHFRISLALLLTLGSAGIAKADDVPDFQFNVQDPPFSAPTITPGVPLTLSFGTCLASETVGGNPASGCAYAENLSGMTITSLEVDIPDTPAFLNQNVTCLNLTSNPTSGSAFLTSSCSLVNNTTYVLLFSGIGGGATGIHNVGTLDLEYYAPPAANLSPSNFTAITTASTAVPEPGSIVLLSSGTLFLGLMMYRRRESLFSTLG